MTYDEKSLRKILCVIQGFYFETTKGTILKCHSIVCLNKSQCSLDLINVKIINYYLININRNPQFANRQTGRERCCFKKRKNENN